MFLNIHSLLISLLLPSTFGLYGPGDNVIELTTSNFDQVYSDDSIWFVEFYAPWCGHCQNLAPEWKQAASMLRGVAKIAAVNVEENKQLGSQFSISGFPTILMFTENKRSSPITYTGDRHHSAIVNEALKQIKRLVEGRLGGKTTGSQGSSQDDVVVLTDANFEETVLNSHDPWLVEFFAPWCGHCKNLKPHWDRAATELKGVVKVGAVDATVHGVLAQRYGVQGYPTIKFFPSGPKKGAPVDYTGGRTSSDIVTWALDKAEAMLPPPELLELTSENVFKQAFEGHPLCVITFVPSLYDCQSECRNRYLNLVKEQASTNKKQKWSWVWTEAGKQPELEERFNVAGSIFPAMVAVHGKKLKYTTLHGAFSADGVGDFLRSLRLGDSNLPLYTISSMPNVATIEPWNGQDAPPLPEDEIDLSELGIKVDL